MSPQIADATITRVANWVTANMLKDTCNILRATRTPVASGSSGGFVITYPAHNTAPVPCAVTDGTGIPQEVVIAAQQTGYILKLIVLPKGTDVLGSDRIQVGAITYHVVDLYEPSTYEFVRRVLARRASLANT